VCLAGTRLLVHERVVQAFTERLREQVVQLRIGDPRDEATEIGPIIHPRQLERIKGFVDRAIASGATCLWGGKTHAFGPLYYEPTLLTNVKQADEIVQNEVFGPVLTLAWRGWPAKSRTTTSGSKPATWCCAGRSRGRWPPRRATPFTWTTAHSAVCRFASPEADQKRSSFPIS